MNTISLLFSYGFSKNPSWEFSPPWHISQAIQAFDYGESRLETHPWRTISFSWNRPRTDGLWAQRVQDWMKTMASPQNRTSHLGERLSDAFRQGRYDDTERLLDDACQRGDIFSESLMPDLETMAESAIRLGRWTLARKAIDILESHRIDVATLRARLSESS